MANLLREGLGWLTSQLQQHAADSVTYVRGSDSVEVVAVCGPRMLRIDDGMGGIRIEWTDMDFLIPSGSLDFGCGPIIPQRGDLVYLGAAHDTEVYEVLPFGSEPCYRLENGDTMTRVHTKRIDIQQFTR